MNTFFKYWLNTRKYYHKVYEYCHNICEYWAGEYIPNHSYFSSFNYEESDKAIFKGKSWRLLDKYLFWSSEEAFYQSADEIWTIFIPLNTTEEILVGKYDKYIQLAQDLHSVDITITSSDEDCFLTLSHKILDKKDFDLSFKNGITKVLTSKYQTEPLCKVISILDALGNQC